MHGLEAWLIANARLGLEALLCKWCIGYMHGLALRLGGLEENTPNLCLNIFVDCAQITFILHLYAYKKHKYF